MNITGANLNFKMLETNIKLNFENLGEEYQIWLWNSCVE